MTKKLILLLLILRLPHFAFGQQPIYSEGLKYAIQGNFYQAREELKKGIPPNHLMILVLNDAIDEKIGRQTAIYIFQGYKNAWENNWDGMLTSFNKAIENSNNYINAYLIRASLYYDLELFDSAIVDYTKVIQLDPNNFTAYLERGSLYTHAGKYDEAIPDCSKAIEINPYIETPYNNRGVAYYFKGEYDRAISDYLKALEIQPRLVRTYYALATAFDDKGDEDNAIKYYKFFIEYAPIDQFESLIDEAKKRLNVLGKEKI